MTSRGWFWALSAVHCACAVIPHPVARAVTRATKPLLMPTLAASSPGAPTRVKVALVASTVGDIALLSSSTPGVLGGIAGFGLAHVAYLRELLARWDVPRPVRLRLWSALGPGWSLSRRRRS